MRRRAVRFLVAATVVGLVGASGAGAASAATVTFAPGEYDNTLNTVNATGTAVTNNQTTGLFRDVFWWSTRFTAGGQIARPSSADYINSGNNLVPCGLHACPNGTFTALNFTGDASSDGTTYLTLYDSTPADGVTTRNLFSATGGLTISADVMFPADTHPSCGGVVVAYSEGQDGLALVACDGAGNNPDFPRLSLVFQADGVPAMLAETSLPFTTFAGNSWYNVSLTLTANGDNWSATGTFRGHTNPADPTSPLLAAVLTSINTSGTFSDPDASARVLSNPGEVGIIASTSSSLSDGGCPPSQFPNLTGCNDNVGVTVTNFTVPQAPEPASLVLLGTGLLALTAGLRRRRR